MATAQMNRVRTIKKIEKPRLKLRNPPTVDGRITTLEVLSLMDNVATLLNNGNTDQNNVIAMCNQLKMHAHQLEAIYKDQLDRAFVAIRNGSQDERLDLTTRVYLLELIELRAKQWHHSNPVDDYYSQKLMNIDNAELMCPETPTGVLTFIPSSPSAMLSPGEVIKNSGKFTKPTRIPGKNYCKDEVVIRNSDSGKVNPGAKERLVQITGTSEDKIHYAKDLIKDTIQRNASPVRLESGVEKSGIGGSSSSLNSSASDESSRLQQQQQGTLFRPSLLHSFSTNDASIGEYKYTVTVGNQSMKITGSNLELVKTAKLVLDSYFAGELDMNATPDFFTFDEESSFGNASQAQVQAAPSTPVQASLMNFQNESVKETETIKTIEEDEKSSSKNIITLSYEFLLLCATGPYAKRVPADWARIQKEVPSIVRKTPIRWFEPDAYKAKVAASGLGTVLPYVDDVNDID